MVCICFMFSECLVAMGDLKNSLELLRREMRKLHSSNNSAPELDYSELLTGSFVEYLRLYRFLLCEYSIPLTGHLVQCGFELTGRSDRRFVEVFYKIQRDELNIKPLITAAQFSTSGFAERKAHMAANTCSAVRALHLKLCNLRTADGSATPKHSRLQTASSHKKIWYPIRHVPDSGVRKAQPVLEAVNVGAILAEQKKSFSDSKATTSSTSVQKTTPRKTAERHKIFDPLLVRDVTSPKSFGATTASCTQLDHIEDKPTLSPPRRRASSLEVPLYTRIMKYFLKFGCNHLTKE